MTRGNVEKNYLVTAFVCPTALLRDNFFYCQYRSLMILPEQTKQLKSCHKHSTLPKDGVIECHNKNCIASSFHDELAEPRCSSIPPQSIISGNKTDNAHCIRTAGGYGPLDIEALGLESVFPTSSVDGDSDVQWVITDDYAKRKVVEEFVKLVQAHASPAWELASTRKGPVYLPTTIGRFCESALAFLSDLDDHTFPSQNRYSERFHVFLDACREVRLAGYVEFGSRLRDPESRRLRCEAENALVASVRAKTRTREFRDRLRHREARTEKNRARGLDFLNRAFNLCGRLLVVRVDLHYKSGSRSAMSLDQLRLDLLTFWRLRRQDADKAAQDGVYARDPLIGYCRAIEFGAQKGYHAHCLLFFDGYKVKSSYFHGNELGKIWRRVIGDEGTFFNCAAKINAYPEPYLGLVDRNDEQKRSWIFKHGIGYMAKDDECSAIMLPRVRRFQTSELREKSASGRPCLPLDERKQNARSWNKTKPVQATVDEFLANETIGWNNGVRDEIECETP